MGKTETNQMPIARELIKRLFDALDIKRVVCVDDVYDRNPSLERFLDLCLELDKEDYQSIEEMQDFDFEDQDIFVRQIESLWKRFDEEQRVRIYKQLRDKSNKHTDSDDTSILSANRLKELLNGCQFQELTLSDWKKEKIKLLREMKSLRTLFLFDQDFSTEGGSSTGGIELIRDILSTETQRELMCGLLSHTFDTEKEYPLWIQSDIDKEKCIFISKAWLRDDLIGFVRKVQLAVLNPKCKMLREKADSVLREAQDKAHKEIEQITIYDFEHIVFQSSQNEGVWEPDTLFRLFGLFHRKESRKIAKLNQELNELATQIRSVSSIRSNAANVPEHSSWAIQRLEFYEDAHYINSLHMPIELGDIFELNSDIGSKQFILLGQPCDLMIRSDGKRNDAVTEVFLAEIVDPPSQKKDLPSETHYKLSYYLENGHNQFVKFRQRHSVDLHILDLCAYRQDGSAMLKTDDPCPDNVIPTWKNHYTELVEFATRAVEKYSKLQVSFGQLSKKDEDAESAFALTSARLLILPTLQQEGKSLYIGQINPVESSISYNLKRVGRLCQPHASALLANFASYLARAAFEHDFGK